MYSLVVIIALTGTISFVVGQNAPVFDANNDGDLRSRLSQGIVEGTTVGTYIGQLKAFVPGSPNTVVQFRGISTTLAVTFDGNVTLSRELDREETSQGGNDLQAKWLAYYTNNNEIIETQSTVTVTVIDTNDNNPEFQNVPYSAQIPEDTAVGNTVFSGIRILDSDIGIHAEVELTCFVDLTDSQTVEACGYFNLTTQQLGQGLYSGAVILKKPLDYEFRKGFTMTIQAKDNYKQLGGAPSLMTTVNVLLEIEDQQDTPPLFMETPITIFVIENLPVGTPVATVTAKDGDEGSPRPIKIVNKDPNQLFRVGDAVKKAENTWVSQVLINNPIDREVLQARYQFDIQAIEVEFNGTETNQRTDTTITVNIQDMDDNQPEFEFPSYMVNVTEMGSQTSGPSTLPGLTMKVTDPDDASFAGFNITITKAVPFENNFLVSPDNGVGSALISLTIVNPSLLDYEVADNRIQTVTVVATDKNNASRTSVTVVTINILDANDNYPEFSQAGYFFSAREDLAVGQPIGSVTGTDRDSGLNAALRYRLSGTGADVFNVNADTGSITLAKPLDFEVTPRYELLYIAVDQGSSPRQTSVPLSIQIINYNDFGPVFNPPTYTTSIRETDLSLLIPVTVQATDKESLNNITYRIVAGNTPPPAAFILGLNTGVLSVTRTINYNETPNNQGFFVLTVEATDADQPPQRTNTTITVSIIDENNHDPIFAPTVYSGSISEIAPRDTPITTVSATDADFGSNGNIKYYIWSGGQDNFAINANNGAITVSTRKNLDYDNIKLYNVTIHARDEGGPPRTGTASVLVTITDANNKLPVFPKQVYTTNIQESVGIGAIVDTVTATDPDSTSSLVYSILRSSIVARDSNGAVINSVFPFDYRDAFTINNVTGLITTALKLSRDAAATIDFNVQAQDINAQEPSPQTATADVLITILADASVDPYFAPPWTVVNPNYNFRISEETNVQTMLTTLIATDPAISENVQNFEEVPGSDIGDYFSVDRTTGQIRIKKRLDYESLNNKFLELGVIAIGTQAQTTASVTIQVTDINDNAPQFLASEYSFSVDEDRVYPTQVGNIYASDLDSGSYASVQYSLTGQGAGDFLMFTSSKQEGLVFIRQGTKLDHETIPVYNLQVVATDNYQADSTAEVKQTNTAELTITVRDVNDNTPVFNGNYSFFTVESYEVGRVIGMVTATDGDRGLFGEILYTLEAMDELDDLQRFSVHPDNGAFSSKSSLEGLSRRSPIHFKIIAQDQGSPPRIGVTYVEVNITSGQLDDGLPYWTRPAPDTILQIPEGQDSGKVIYTCKATAVTKGASIDYSFVSSSDPDIAALFSINRQNCEIKLEKKPDREFREIYDLIIVAEDTLNSTLRSSRKLTIRLTDVDDEIPSFKNCPDRQYADPPPEPATVVEQSPPGTLVFTAKACDKDSNPLFSDFRYKFDVNPPNFTHCYRNPSLYFHVDELSGQVTTYNNTIDRERNWPTIIDHFILCIKAEPYYSGGRRKRQIENVNWNYVNTDQYLYLRVTVLDINDQAPYFKNPDTITTAVLKFPTQDDVIHLKAEDRDSDLYNKIRFTVTSTIFPSLGRMLPIDGAFSVNPETGMIRVGMPAYIAFTDGHFLLNVKAEDQLDSTKMNSTQIKIFVANEASQVRLVGQTNDLSDPSATADSLLEELSARGGNTFHIQRTKIQYHTTLSGETVHAQTDICFVVIKNDRVLDSQQGTAEISSSPYSDILSKFKVGDAGPCDPPTRKSTYDAYWWILVAFAICMFIIVLVLIVLVVIFYRNYRQYMDTRKQYLIQD
ncbi:cadherin-87A-like [Mytilus edulis]|uniref:cadherin-87A-like n=1 Tax=Mytilus edulis TaxID=6550 RepID=UPI0039EF0C9E